MITVTPEVQIFFFVIRSVKRIKLFYEGIFFERRGAGIIPQLLTADCWLVTNQGVKTNPVLSA